MRTILGFLVLSAIYVFLTGCTRSQSTDVVIVPLERVHERMLRVRVTVGGEDLLFLVDTGAAITAVDIRVMDRLNLPPPCEHEPMSHLVTGGAKTKHFHNVAVRVGTVDMLFRRFEAVDLSSVMPSVSNLLTDEVGVLGADCFHDNGAVIDFNACEMRIPVSKLNKNNGEPGGAANGSQPIRSEANGTSPAAGSRHRPLRWARK